jgi:uncharacterized membrane protein YdjX (TVP38/TMEM64 family)
MVHCGSPPLRFERSIRLLGRLALLALVVLLFVSLYAAGFFELIQEPERVRAAVEGLGLWGPVLYVLAFALLEPFFVPGLAFMIPGAMVWDFSTLYFLSWLGAVGAGLVGFGFARYLGRDYVERHLPPSFREYDARLAAKGLRTVIAVRVVLFLAPPAHWLLGLSQVRFAPFLLGSMIGFLPGMALLSYLVVFVGGTLAGWLTSQPKQVWIGLVMVGAMLIALRRWRRRLRARRRSGSG